MKKNSSTLGGFFDLPQKQEAIKSIQDQMTQANFWDDSSNANKLMRELKYLKSCIEPFEEGFKKLEECKEMATLSKDESEMLEQIQQELSSLEEDVNKVEIQSILGGTYDQNNVILSINAGAGGTESCDWASMLLSRGATCEISASRDCVFFHILDCDQPLRSIIPAAAGSDGRSCR